MKALANFPSGQFLNSPQYLQLVRSHFFVPAPISAPETLLSLAPESFTPLISSLPLFRQTAIPRTKVSGSEKPKVIGEFSFPKSFTKENEQAWDLFGWRNGDVAHGSFLQRLSSYRKEDLSIPANRRKPMGCTVLREAHFWPEHRWLSWGKTQGWANNIVQGKGERDLGRAALLMRQIELDAVAPPEEFAPAFELVDADERLWVESRTVRREGQGTFRLRLLEKNRKTRVASWPGCSRLAWRALLPGSLIPRNDQSPPKRALTLERDTGFEPATPSLGKSPSDLKSLANN